MPTNHSTPSGPASTRERILAYFQENRVVTVQALSQAWGLTRADIRYHLKALQDEQVIERIPHDSTIASRRGRPEQTYRMTTSAIPDNFPSLCSALLDTLFNGQAGHEDELTLHAITRQLAKNFITTANPPQRLNQAIVFLNQQGYRARWEAHASGPQILLRNCPYAAILSNHPELCKLDRHLLEYLTQANLNQTTQINLVGGKPLACIFISR